jgi:hypothetical protein
LQGISRQADAAFYIVLAAVDREIPCKSKIHKEYGLMRMGKTWLFV